MKHHGAGDDGGQSSPKAIRAAAAVRAGSSGQAVTGVPGPHAVGLGRHGDPEKEVRRLRIEQREETVDDAKPTAMAAHRATAQRSDGAGRIASTAKNGASRTWSSRHSTAREYRPPASTANAMPRRPRSTAIVQSDRPPAIRLSLLKKFASTAIGRSSRAATEASQDAPPARRPARDDPRQEYRHRQPHQEVIGIPGRQVGQRRHSPDHAGPRQVKEIPRVSDQSGSACDRIGQQDRQCLGEIGEPLDMRARENG